MFLTLVTTDNIYLSAFYFSGTLLYGALIIQFS